MCIRDRIITADHGESFYEHNFFEHQGTIFEELLNIPLILIEIGKKPQITITKDAVQLIDIAPTILNYFGIDVLDSFQGRSLLPILKGKELEKVDIIFSECYQKNGLMKRNHDEGYILLAIRKEGWKYIYDEEKKKEYLFNLNNDPYERTNLFNKKIDKLNEFRKIRNKHIQQSIISTKKNRKF